ncbi:RNA 2'-phosphotransferase [Aquimarina sp. TRL1]|uniref:RNA 2'-phosphotransferase n=1 Tax=Aquimarina sp. (strain TRL1) TaxID=2736252 RepID=UPI00158DE03A|nr:RNA 2'-phosphotransferase [Aquimarina sp. TRL1]QKX05792.1 RNA 2'-phosphotransferase [Aquimarina sp. TRL1]
MKNNDKRIGKFLSLILRHQPEKIGIQLDKNGWVEVSSLLEKIKVYYPQLDQELLEHLVKTNDKQRYAFNDDKTKIRANQGHSVSVALAYEAEKPPEMLYHGTIAAFMKSICKEGLLKMNRHHVHLSQDIETATKVGARRGKPVILFIQSGKMYREGISFFKSKNGVWLTESVPSRYINVTE